MPTADEKNFMQRCLDAVREGTPGFRSRRPQLEMIAAVARTLARAGSPEADSGSGEHLAVIEAGTGTGKTLGYLLPALVLGHMRGRRVIVSSSTVTLQEQLLHKDVPALVQLLPFEPSFAVAKGRRRFLCPARLSALLEPRQANARRNGQPAHADEGARDGEEALQGSPSLLSWCNQLAQAFDAGRWSADRDAWPGSISDRLWGSLSTDRQGCLGTLCPSSACCPYYLGRQLVGNADLVIANHDLVLACADRDATSTLPELRESLVVFDEAHSLPGKVVDHGASRHSVCAAGAWVTQTMQVAQAARKSLPARLAGADVPDPAASAGMLRATLEALQDAVGRHCEFKGQQRVSRFTAGGLPPEIRACGEAVHQAVAVFEQEMSILRSALLRHAGDDAKAVQPHLALIGPAFGKLANMAQTWDWMPCEEAPDATRDALPVARWIERQACADGGDDFRVCASAISGGPRLRSLLWEHVGAAVLASATLRACGRFDLFMEDAGLQGFAALEPMSLASPFDHARKGTLYIASDIANPRDVPAHTLAITQRLPALLARQRGTLVLFASRRQMREVHDALPYPLKASVLMQGTCSRRELITRHRACIDGGGMSTLFGLAAMAEGVDLPGAYCTHVICAKLPFSVPDSPVELARREWIEAQGGSAFLERSVSEVAIRLA